MWVEEIVEKEYRAMLNIIIRQKNLTVRQENHQVKQEENTFHSNMYIRKLISPLSISIHL